MNNRRLILLIACAAVLAAYAVWSGSLNGLRTLAGGKAAAVAEVQPPQPAASGAPAEAAPLNPLAGLAAESFGEFVDRPLFNPTRKPPPPVEDVEAAAVAEPQVAAPQAGARAEDFTLLAVAVAGDVRIAVLRWNKTNEVYHLKQGQLLEDWELRSVGEKDVTVGRDEVSFLLKLFDRARPAGAPPRMQDGEAEFPVNPGGQAGQSQDMSEPDPELNSN